MKALSLIAPWGTLIAIGQKTIETRSWPTRYRGEIAIHQSKSFPGWAKFELRYDPFASALDNVEIPLGCVIATARLVDCLPTGCIGDPHPRVPARDSSEYAFGDYSPGRWMWCLSEVRRLDKPIPARGTLGLWEWRPEGTPPLQPALIGGAP